MDRARTRPPQKYPWLRISGSGGQLSTHCPSLPLSLSPQHALTHSLFIIPPPRSRAVVALLGLTTTTTTPSSRIGQVSLHQPRVSSGRPCIPSQPSHFKDELIIHHTPNILSVEKPGRNNKTIVAMVKLKQCWQQLA